MWRADEQVDFALIAAFMTFCPEHGKKDDFSASLVADSKLHSLEHVPSSRGDWLSERIRAIAESKARQ